MRHPPIKRHEALQPFSREHLLGLSIARDLRQAPEQGSVASIAAADRLLNLWRDELRGHFHDEERLLAPLLTDRSMLDRLKHEHERIADLTDQLRAARAANATPDASTVRALGDLLHDHIRWEERALFPAIEQGLTPEAAASLGDETARFSESRVSARTAAERRAVGEPCSTRWDLPPEEHERRRP